MPKKPLKPEMDTSFVRFDLTAQVSFFQLKGKGIGDFLHRITTNNIKKLQGNQLTQTIFASIKGRIIDLVTVLPLASGYLLLGHRNYQQKLQQWIEKYIILEDITVEVTEEFFVWEIFGSQVAEQLEELIAGSGSLETRTLMAVDSPEGYLLRWEYGYWLVGKKSASAAWHEAFSSVPSLNEDQYELLRVRRAIPAAPNELNEKINPLEAHLLAEVDFNKGCYIGQEVIARLDAYDKVQKSLEKFTFDEKPQAEQPQIFNSQGKKVGEITSLVFDPDQNSFVALGYVKKKALAEREELHIIGTENQQVSLVRSESP